MKKWTAFIIVIFISCCFSAANATAQCSICTKTASQLGEKPAKGMNSGILYLMFAPLAIGGFIGYKWWQREKIVMEDEANG